MSTELDVLEARVDALLADLVSSLADLGLGSMPVMLDDLNSRLESCGYLLIVHSWAGHGERELPRDATKLELVTVAEYDRRCAEKPCDPPPSRGPSPTAVLA